MDWNYPFLPDEDEQSRRPLPSIEYFGIRPLFRAPPTDSYFQGRPEPPTFIHQPPAYEQPCFIPQQSEYNALGGQIGHSVSFPNNDPIPGCEPAIHLPVQPPVPDNQPDAILMMPIGQLVVESARYVTENYLRIVTGPLIFRVPEELHPFLIIPQPPPQQPQPLPEMQPQFQRNADLVGHRIVNIQHEGAQSVIVNDNMPEAFCQYRNDAFTERDPVGIISSPPQHQRYDWETGTTTENVQELAVNNYREVSSSSRMDNSNKKLTDAEEGKGRKRKEKKPEKDDQGNVRRRHCYKCGATGDNAHLPSKCRGIRKKF